MQTGDPRQVDQHGRRHVHVRTRCLQYVLSLLVSLTNHLTLRILFLPDVSFKFIAYFCSFFGFLIVISFCDFEFIKHNFLFLKTTNGRGVFDIFCSFMFLITSGASGSITGYAMMGVLMACGIFFLIMGCCGKDPVGEDIKNEDIKKAAINQSKEALL